MFFCGGIPPHPRPLSLRESAVEYNRGVLRQELSIYRKKPQNINDNLDYNTPIRNMCSIS
jgi:hypothetical protein